MSLIKNIEEQKQMELWKKKRKYNNNLFHLNLIFHFQENANNKGR